MNVSMQLWQPADRELVPSGVNTPDVITEYAARLSRKSKRQIVSAFDAQNYEMALNFLWLHTVASLKKELGTVGLQLLGEMLGKTEVSEQDDVEDLLTTRDTIRLAEELGVVNRTEALRLRHTHEMITHFNQLELEEDSSEEIDQLEAINSLEVCVKSVLAKPKIEVAEKFVEFRNALESESFASDEDRINNLISSPYFFWKLTINILMNATKNSSGAQLEHTLANVNVILPLLWPKLRKPEKWQIGRAYAEVYLDGKTISASGLKRALMKVQGFDFVPENLRSNAFVKAAEAVLRAHDGMNNFYNEPSPTRSLSHLGTSIPIPALPACMTALLSVALGNEYGFSWEASPIALKILKKISERRWQYYLDQILPADWRILGKLAAQNDQSRNRWTEVVQQNELVNIKLEECMISKLVKSAMAKKDSDVRKQAVQLLSRYYGENS